ncbi:dihydroorotase [Prochlorococcus sp. MIT 1300]|uniref:dihydroorotase n=1 Tax=Prochlorococcus sp. MIT 1300 TaxID=3096218 RepID=UPI002A74A849|nr:dihydroorotase [Prochlorococcus sp. MIT 1300]
MPLNIPQGHLTLRQPDDWHVHFRDGSLMKSVVSSTARVFRRAIVMPNLSPPITTVEAAIAYRERILSSVPKGISFSPLMTVYLTDNLSVNVLREGSQKAVFTAAKLYPANATTNSSMGVTKITNIYSIFETMEEIGLPLLVHGEVTDLDVDIYDREAVFIDKYLSPILERFPKLRVVLEHITTEQAVQFVQTASENLAATITPHHLHINRNAMFLGGLRSDFYCLPVAKRERHRIALRKAATSGKPCFFLGTDSAPHLRSSKESSCGCAGIFNAHYALESYAEVFEEENALDRLEGFASVHGAAFYGMPLNEDSINLKRVFQVIPERFALQEEAEKIDHLVPFHAGESLRWVVEPMV